MTSSNITLKNVNEIILKNEDYLVNFDDSLNILILYLLYRRGQLTVDQISKELHLNSDQLNIKLNALERNSLISKLSDGSFLISNDTKNRIEYDTIDLSILLNKTLKIDYTVDKHLGHEFLIEELIGKGATSFTFKAKQCDIHKDRVLKIFRPNIITYTQLDSALEKCSRIENDAIPELIEAGQIKITINGKDELLPTVVLQYIDHSAMTFKEYLDSQENFDHNFFDQYILSVGGALAEIEDKGLAHGDLHDRNILIMPPNSQNPNIKFYVIDFIGVPSFGSPDTEIITDIENFRSQFLHAVYVGSKRYDKWAPRNLLEIKSLKVFEKLTAKQYTRFKDIIHDYHKPPEDIPDDFFIEPSFSPFTLTHVEQFSASEDLFLLFEPNMEKYSDISNFENTWISGPKGSGKSHYLRIFAFNPEIVIKAKNNSELATKLKKLKYDYTKKFGILFTCKLGEFNGFSPEVIGSATFDTETQQYLKHILILKIINRTLQTIKDGLNSFYSGTNQSILQKPYDLNDFITFFDDRLGKIGLNNEQNVLKIFDQCHSICIAQENSAIHNWFKIDQRGNERLLNDDDLNIFFPLIKSVFPDLKSTKFYILIDDITFNNIHVEMQKILNSLISLNQIDHCFKFTCDKFMYSSDNIESMKYVDLGEITYKSKQQVHIDLSNYFARVINKRLRKIGINDDIRKILGTSQNPTEFLFGLKNSRKRKDGKTELSVSEPRAYYGGWKIICSLSHGSVRVLLELIDELLKIDIGNNKIKKIPLKKQDTIIRNYSMRQFSNIRMLPEEIDSEPLGEKLQGIISAIGEVSRTYLVYYDTKKSNQFYETISFERSDTLPLDKKAEVLLDKLVTYGLLRDDGQNFSRSELGVITRYDLNKIFSPRFEITYRVRNHIPLRKGKLQKLLLSPDKFIKDYRKALGSDKYQRKLTEFT